MPKKKTDSEEKQIELAETIPPLEYDPLNPSFNVLHRAGMAGLLLQIKAIEKFREQVSNDLKELFPVIDWEYIHNGRGIRINFDINTFRTVLRERYLGVPVLKENDEETETAEGSDKQKKQNVEPRLSYLEAFGASEKFQYRVRKGYSDSFFQIYQERVGFFQHTERNKSNSYLQEKIDNLWNTIANDDSIEIQKSSRPNIFGNDFKANQIKEEGKKALLFHFWALVAGFFKPIGLNIEKDKKTKQLMIEDEYRLASIIVVPDVINVKTFIGEIETTYSQDSNNFISTPLEAPLAFFLAPRLAHNAVITPDILGARGATIFAYKRPLKKGKPDFTRQPEVKAVFDTPLDDALLLQYQKLQKLKSNPYKAMRVENLLAKKVWHYGFNSLVDKFPLEIFVPTQKESGEWNLHFKAQDLAKDLSDDFKYFKNKENKMNDEEINIPTIIDEIVNGYLRWRIYNRGQNPPNKEDIQKVFGKRKEDLTKIEKDIYDDYIKRKSEGIKKEFVDFRGATDQNSFAEMFVTRFFEAGQDTSPEQRQMLRPYYEGEKWESGRWLVLMALSAANESRGYKQKQSTKSNDNDIDDDI